MIWTWDYFWELLRDDGFLQAAFTTLWVAIVAQIGATIVGCLVAVCYLSRSRVLRGYAALHVWVWRGTPLLIQLFVVYLGLPQLGISLPVVVAGLTCLILNESAYMGIVIAASLRSIDAGQRDAARSLGFSRLGSLVRIELPQAARSIVPTLGNQFNTMLKTTALLSVISFSELVAFTVEEIAETYRPFEPYVVASLYYLGLSTMVWVIQAIVESRLGKGYTTTHGGGRTGLGGRLLTFGAWRSRA